MKPTSEAINLARKYVHVNMLTEDSAKICLADAVKLYDQGNLKAARRRAKKSLAYSIGILHPDYAKVIV